MVDAVECILTNFLPNYLEWGIEISEKSKAMVEIFKWVSVGYQTMKPVKTLIDIS